jgi:pimeloyl-ACP methyl ester carboxylesterase
MPETQVIEPENARYTADLVFLHGLWTGPQVWTAVAGGFAHRGWRCVLVDLRPEPRNSREDFAALCNRVEELARGCSPLPVVVGHDLGGLVTLALAGRGAARAGIAVAPLLEGTRGLVPWPRRAAARLGLAGGSVPPPPVSHPYFACDSAAGLDRLAKLLVDEPARRVLSLRGQALVPRQPAVPTLLVGHEADPIVPAVLVEVTARGLETDFMRLPGGHWPMLAERIDPWVTALHRWIIKRAGDSLLLLRGDEDLS